MRTLRSLWRTLFRRGDVERQMADELSFHIEARAADLMSRDRVSHAEAVRRARIEFGSIEKYKEEGRASLGLRLIDELRGDIRFARRTLTKNLGFSAAAISILALGIGANTAVFSVVDALLYYQLPVKSPDELVAFDSLHTRDTMMASYSGSGRPGPGGTARRTSFSTVTFERFRGHATTLSHVFAFASLGSVTVVAENNAEIASAQAVSGGYFDGLGVAAVRGRTLGPADDQHDAEPAIVVSHRYWQRRFLGDPEIIGKSVLVNRTSFTVVGVTAADFHGTEVTETVDVSLPLAIADRLSPTGKSRPISSWWLLLMGRLKPGVTASQVLAELQPIFNDTVVTSWAAKPAETRDPWRSEMPVLRVNSGAQGPNGPSPLARANVMLVFAVAGVVLLIACVNVASLLLVRAANRRQEMTVRRALGAGRARLIRQLLSESLMLAAAGAAAGLVLAWWAKDALPRMLEDEVILDTAIDFRVVAFAGGLMALTALVFGVGHAVRATRGHAMPWVKTDAGTGGQRALVARTLIGVQIAASLVLLVVAGLFGRTLHNYSQVDVGFETSNMLVFRLNPGPPAGAPAGTFDLYERVMAAIDAVPGVRSATLSAMPVVARNQWSGSVRADGASDVQEVHIQTIRWNFFETMGIPLLAGRGLQSSDGEGAPRVAVINLAMGQQVFNDRAPIGQHFQFVDGSNRGIPIQVVGVVQDSKYARLNEPAPPTFFMPYTQVPPQPMTVEVRTTGDALALTATVRAAVSRVDPGLPLMQVRTQEQQIAETIRGPRTFAALTAVSGAIGLLLACIGLYGVVAYDAKRRTNEIGVRMALGAQRSDVLRLVMGQALWIVTIGAAFGLVLAVFGSRLISNQLFGVQPSDFSTLASAAALLVAVACLAVFIPARRASHFDPTQALRCE
jgi:predicted permease